MNFELTQDQQMLAESIRQFVRKESPVSRLRALRKDERGWEPAMWKRMGEQGWLGIPFPEEVGGIGGTFVDMMLLLEAMGTQLVPEPVIGSVVLGGLPISFAGNAEQQRRWLEPLVAGERSLALAHIERETRYSPQWIATRANRDGAGWKLSGEKIFVLNGHAADTLVVAARTGGAPGESKGISLFVVDGDAAGLHRRAVKGMDGHHYGLIRLENVAVGAEALLGAEGEACPVLERVLDYGAAAAVCEGYGIAQTMLDMTVEYLKTRKQFGVFIGAFQGLQHRAVDMFVETELCRSMAILAAIEVDNAEPHVRAQAVSAAKVQLATGGKQVSQQSIQLHGGIGVTDEHDIGLYFKRMHVLNTICGDERHHTSRYADSPAFLAAR